MTDLPPTVRFHLFSDPDDAWAGGVATWIREVSERSLSGRRAWIVSGSYVQGNWLRYRCLREGIPVYGIQFMDERRFRRELCRHYGLPTPAFGRETLLLLLRAHLDRVVADSAWPSQCLQGLDELANTGWLTEHGLEAALDRLRVPGSARAIVERITESLLWRPRVDRQLANCARVWPELDLLIYGPPYEALLAPELFSAGLKTVASASIWVAQPFGSAELCFAAIEQFEKEVGAAFEIVPASDGDRPFAAFAAEYNSGVESPSVHPDLWMSRRWSDQIHLAAAIVRSRLQAGDERIAVVVPHDSPTGPAIVRTLQSNDVPTADEYRTPVAASRERTVQLWLAKQIEQDRQPEDLLALIERLVREPQAYGNIRRFVLRRFEDIQTRDVDRLINRKTAPAWAVDLLALGNQWPERATWEEFNELWMAELERCQEILRSAGGDILPVTLSLEPLQPNWGEIGVTLRGLLISRTLFCNYVRETLQDAPPEAQPGTGDRYSRVIVSTPERLAGTAWDTVVFLDQVGDAPVRPGSLSGLLDPSFRMEARTGGFLFLQTGDNFALTENLTLQILAGVRRHAALCWYQETDEGEEVDANFFVTTCQTLDGARVKQVQIPERFELAPAEFDPMLKAYRNRRDSQQPFDVYSFCFGPEPQPQNW
ncbi:MAG: hypothetical protein JO308_10975, partial [Verrucomicrobia bacterium]|nr:hypothetical protein [Verrucomicrobiota bacterium]